MYKIIVIILAVAFVAFIMVLLYAMLVRMSEEERLLEDEEQIKYLEQWMEDHRDDRVRKDQESR